MDEKIFELKIESEIGGGSLSIFKYEELLYSSEGFLIEKKSDHIIEVLKDSLLMNRIKIENLKSIRYSEYPGSQMGLKILASIVKGLSLPYEIDISGKNIFESLFEFYRGRIEGEFCIVLPVNKRESVLETSRHNVLQPDKKFQTDKLLEIINEFNESEIKMVLPLKIFNNVLNDPNFFPYRDRGKLIDTGDNLSTYL